MTSKPLKQVFEYTLANLNDVAKKIIASSTTSIWLINGQMGAGKTTLIQEICKQLGVTDSVQSPTYSIVNEYTTTHKTNIYHFDFYRLKSEEEAYDFGYEEYFYSGNLCLIEWASQVPSLIPDAYLEVEITILNESSRSLSIQEYSL